MRIGNGFVGSDSLKVSSAMEQVVPTPPITYPFKKYSFYQFSFLNHDADCSVYINDNANPIFLRAGQGFESDAEDMPIYSFIIKEAGITYNYLAAF
jgi:hypothetical protein